MRAEFRRAGAMVATILLFGGCTADHPLNPTFRLGVSEVQTAWREMEATPKPLDRPLIVLAGWYDPGLVSGAIAERMRRITTDRHNVFHITFMNERSFDECAEKVVRLVQRFFPSDDPATTVEVDVIGFSMGGLVARHAARNIAHLPRLPPEHDGDRSVRVFTKTRNEREPQGPRALNVHRLFTIGTPHGGARLAWFPTFDRRVADMRGGSKFLARLNEEATPYSIYPYVRLGDFIVGAENAAPPGRHPWWVGRTLGLSHMMAGSDVRILADIARRVRGERPFTREPAAPVPQPHRVLNTVAE